MNWLNYTLKKTTNFNYNKKLFLLLLFHARWKIFLYPEEKVSNFFSLTSLHLHGDKIYRYFIHEISHYCRHSGMSKKKHFMMFYLNRFIFTLLYIVEKYICIDPHLYVSICVCVCVRLVDWMTKGRNSAIIIISTWEYFLFSNEEKKRFFTRDFISFFFCGKTHAFNRIYIS